MRPGECARLATKYGLDGSDGLAALGVLALEVGIAQWSHAAAWVVGGALLIAVAIGPALRKGSR